MDKSNGNGSLILLPIDIFESLTNIRQILQGHFGVKKLGMVLVDSHCLPLRAGVVWTCIGWSGFKALESVKGQTDLYGKPLQVTQVNVADSLAVVSDYIMGQSDQRTPLVVIENPFPITFCEDAPTQEEKTEFFIPQDKDLYGNFFKKGKV